MRSHSQKCCSSSNCTNDVPHCTLGLLLTGLALFVFVLVIAIKEMLMYISGVPQMSLLAILDSVVS